MGNIDSLTELANTLDIFFKGLSECNLLTKYSLQLQATAVDSQLQIKFHFLVYQFMKNLQSLLLKIPKIPGQEIGYDVATQTIDESEYIEMKILEQPISEIAQPTWIEEKHEIKEDMEPSCLNTRANIIVTCNPQSHPFPVAITSHRFVSNDAIGMPSVTESTDDDRVGAHLETAEPIACESLMHVVVSSADSDDTSSNSAIFICETCDKTFCSARSLSQHLALKHRNKGQCDMCLRTFASVQSLQQHCRTEHDGSGCFTCAVCSRRFMTKLSYGRHMDTHNGKKGAVCDICGKMFSRADYLQKHYMTHTNTRPFSCKICAKRFVSTSQKKVHEKTHTGLKDHICDVCHKGFGRGDKLKDHMMRHLSIKRFNCSLCQRSYAEKRDLTKHLKVHNVTSPS